MLSIDAAILNMTERWCRRFQRLTGRTNVWLAFQLTNLSIVVYFAWAALLWMADGAPRLYLAIFCGVLLYGLTQTVLKVPVETYEASAFQRVAKGMRNPRRIRDAPLRLPFLTLSLLLFYPIVIVYRTTHLSAAPVSYSLVVLTTTVLYLLACDPLPPCPGTLREWIRSWVPSRAAATAPADAPASESRAHNRLRARRRASTAMQRGRSAGPRPVSNDVRRALLGHADRLARGEHAQQQEAANRNQL